MTAPARVIEIDPEDEAWREKLRDEDDEPEWFDEDAANDDEPEPPQNTPQPADRWHAQDFASSLDSPLPEIRMLVEELDIGPGRPTGLWSAPGAGKNITAQSIALCVATGRPVFGRFAVQRGRVLHVSYDMGRVATELRYRQLANGLGITREELAGQLIVSVFPEINLTDKTAAAEFYARFQGFDLVIVDNLRTAIPGIQENDSTFGDYMNVLHQAGDRAGCTVLYLHHTRKEDGPMTLESGRGTSATLGGSGAILGIECNGKGERKFVHLRPHDMAMGLRAPMWLCLHVDKARGTFDTGKREGSFRLEAVDEAPAKTDKERQAKRELREKILTAVRASPGIGTVALRKAVGGNSGDCDDTIEGLLKAFSLKDEKEGQNHHYYVTEGT
jgi:hypothetical protein